MSRKIRLSLSYTVNGKALLKILAVLFLYYLRQLTFCKKKSIAFLRFKNIGNKMKIVLYTPLVEGRYYDENHGLRSLA